MRWGCSSRRRRCRTDVGKSGRMTCDAMRRPQGLRLPAPIRRPERLRLPAILLGVTFAVACATTTVTCRRELSFMSEAQEISIAQETDPRIKQEMGVYGDPALQEYVSAFG